MLNLSEKDYGFLVSIAGAGIVVCSITTALFTERLAVAVLMGVGSVMVSVGYIIYAFSHDFLIAGIGFFIPVFIFESLVIMISFSSLIVGMIALSCMM
ncbi:hypothetical protein [Sporosarcina limicola]|uniref:Uncharacterized protein n=1 Tax=Sporosarcina limicola TaxID=34101 RepID=A0A927MMT5_9BACL|nr:hypothetical protein [Sporosarcina limicola]MBE1556843.1 hypothetical protein [Sporosarcina limicola]